MGTGDHLPDLIECGLQVPVTRQAVVHPVIFRFLQGRVNSVTHNRSKVRLAGCSCTLGPGGALPGQAGAGLGGGGFQNGLSLQAPVPGQTTNYSHLPY